MATTMASTQLDALVTLRAKLARRYWASAFITRYSPLLFIAVLSYVYFHTEVKDIPGSNHANITFDMGGFCQECQHGFLPGFETHPFAVLNRLQWQLFGPLPVIPLYEFVDLSTFARKHVNTTLLKQYGAQIAGIFGSAMTLGTLHLSPDTALTRELVEHLKSIDVVFNKSAVPLKLHASEEAAVAYIEKTTAGMKAMA